MSKKNLVGLMDGYDNIIEEMRICRKYGIDYSARKGRAERLVNLLHPKTLRLKVGTVIRETGSTSTFRMAPVDGYLPPFQAGQYINLFVEIDGVLTGRPYSISSAPHQSGFYDITVRRVDRGFVSDYLLDAARPGDEFESSGPAGNFYYNPLFQEKHMVCLAGGSGITPFMSMIREVTDRGLDRKITLLYGNRREDDIIFHAELKDRSVRYGNFVYRAVISEPTKACKELSGFITADLIRSVVGDTVSRTFYICGPSDMYGFCIPELGKLGIPEQKIRREMYGPPRDIASEPGWPKDVDVTAEFKLSILGGKSLRAKAGESVLAALERAGVVVPSLCRSGECSMCRVKLVSGKVFQPAGVLLRQSDRELGFIHSCAAYPISDLEIRL